MAILPLQYRLVMAESSDTMDMKEFQLHEKDTGSADVQVALLTRRISQLTDHLKSHVKDHSSRRGLLKMVAQRRSLLDYLSRSESDRYKKGIEKLNLRNEPQPGSSRIDLRTRVGVRKPDREVTNNAQTSGTLDFRF